MGRQVTIDIDELAKFLSPENPMIHYEGYYGHIVSTDAVMNYITGYSVEEVLEHSQE